MFEIKEIIDLALQIEKNGEKIYRKALRHIENPAIYTVLQKLADEELNHIEWFTSLKQSIKSTTDDPKLVEMGKTILNRVLGAQAFSLEDVEFFEISRIDDLLKLAIEFEKDTILFYEMFRPLLSHTEELNHLDQIIAEENQHIEHFQDALNSGGFESL